MDSAQLDNEFKKHFGGETDNLLEVRAPGRVNLIGEHTDYNDGFVFPMAIERDTALVFRRRKDQLVRMVSASQPGEPAEFSFSHEVSKGPPLWSLYARGVTEALRHKKLITTGIDALVATNVPLGGGLSSSASFEVATALALLTASHATMDRIDMALACQWAEHHYPGMPCGIMDQFISALAQRGHAMLLDCRDRSYKQVPLNDPAVRVAVVNSNVKHELVGGEYKLRRQQCETAVAALAQKQPGVKALRDATMPMLDQAKPAMDSVVYRRARHVIGENQRALGFAAALEARDYSACGRLLYASHVSLRDDYQVSCPELDTLVELARSVDGVFGARMTGGGFGGCIVVLLQQQAFEPLSNLLHIEYPKRYQKQPAMFGTLPGAGARVVRG
ncbi:MAG: galactokinase [Phycisphaerae bacterium]